MLRRISLFAALLLAACGGGSGAAAPGTPEARAEADPLVSWIAAEAERLSEAAGVLGDDAGEARDGLRRIAADAEAGRALFALAAQRHIGKGVGHQGLRANLLLDQAIEVGNGSRAAGEQDVIDIIELARGKEELQGTRDLLDYSLFERLQNFAVVVIRETALFFCKTGFLHRQTIATLNLFGKLLAAKQLLAGVDGPPVVQNAEGGHGRANIDHGYGQLIATAAHLLDEQAIGTLQGIGFDVYHSGCQPGQRQGGFAHLDVLLATRRQQHFDAIRIARGWPLHFEVDRHFFKRVGNILVGFDRQLIFQLVVGKTGLHLDGFGNHRRTRDGHSDRFHAAFGFRQDA
jgi:hypothetical protein